MEATHTEQEVDFGTAEKLGLIQEEYDRIIEILGRTPNFTELSIFAVMWSEHCSYKNSIKWLKTLPRTGPHMLVEAGEENAGLVDIGGGLGCVFKIESHNHPSAIEPYQGAATGVGGINRDIFTMGARPVAQLNSLRFGNIDKDRTQWIMKGVVKGIGDYGNAFGVPVVGGEVFFDEVYDQNPLVNAMSAGILDVNKTISAISEGVGNPVYIVGSSTGKDGIHGATFASGDLTEESAKDLPSVQVGDPFQEKLLLEATLELADTDAIVGMQDMGAAGITCSTSEMSEKGGCGMEIHLDKVPTRQSDMKPYEILLSESQERMLVVVHKGKEQVVEDIFDKWDLNAVQIGTVTEGDTLRYFMHGESVAEVPASELVLGGGAPVYDREYREPAYYAESKKFSIDSIEEPTDLKAVAQAMLDNVNLGSKRWVTDQYDSMVGTKSMNTNDPRDAGIVDVRGTDKALALTVDCNARYVHADPEVGTAIAVSEAARNIVCSGGEPSAITNCLNFGNPYTPEVYWQFVGAIKGMGRACRRFETPVTGGNVSFYNHTVLKEGEVPVFPTPTIGMLGIVMDKSKTMSLNFKRPGDRIFLIGRSRNDINASEYLSSYHGVRLSPPPHFDLEEEYALQEGIKSLIAESLIDSAHDVSDGGLFQCLVEKGQHRQLGFNISTDTRIRKDAFLFGESQSRVVVSVDDSQAEDLSSRLAALGLDYLELGTVSSGAITIDGESYFDIREAIEIHDQAIESRLK
ncbi:MAG: phosphoribosylformylglycinamidine synthase subunit PurL [Flavobacteriales bacterium]|nr:phosphoribosylformylglycinamidine synthase subunit PurL [Flavobacteriales bacterium]